MVHARLIIGTSKVPASFFHCALAFESGQPVHHWIPSSTELPLHLLVTAPGHQPQKRLKHISIHITHRRVSSTRMGQAVLVVTEPHSELNAGLIVVFRSSHPPHWDVWALRCGGFPGLSLIRSMEKSVAFGSSRHLGSNPRGQVVSGSLVVTSHHASVVPETHCSWLYLDTYW